MAAPACPVIICAKRIPALLIKGYRVVAFDQLGTGASDRPDDPALWTIGRYVEETETVRKVLGLGKVHMLGHSWGGWLGIDYALTYPENLQTLILEDTVADMPHLIVELERLRAALGSETVAMMQKHEARGTYRSPGISGGDHHPQLPPCLPPFGMAGAGAPVARRLEHGSLCTMQGPNEFLYIGNLKDWNRVPDLHRDHSAGADHLRRA
jgi:proline iminopeptidase